MNVEFRDYYETLGVPRTATQAEIKKAFRKLARQHHPDVKPGDAAAEARFKAINEANEVLSDPEKRKRYDELGAHWDTYGPGGPGGGPGSRPGGGAASADPFGPGGPFAGFARGGAGSGPGGVRYEFHTVGADDAGFSDFFRMFFGGGMGGMTDLDAMGGMAGAPGAGGTGAGRRSQGSPGGAGAGSTGGPQGGRARAGGDRGDAGTSRGRAGRPAPLEAEVEIALEEAALGTTRLVEVDGKRLEVKIPRGVDTGSRVRLRGKGGDGRDLVLVVRVRPHPVFTRVGADLSRDLPVTLREALLGAEVTLATLDGRVLLKIPTGTQSGRTIRLKGKGMPILSKDERGDLLVKVRVVLPVDLSEEAKAAAEGFLDLVHQPDPRGG